MNSQYLSALVGKLPGYVLAVLLLTIGSNLVQAAPVPAGTPAPETRLPSLTEPGKTIELASLRGKVVYVDFWASWCVPCRVSFPLLNELRAELGDQGFEVMAINVDEDTADALGFLEELPVDYLVVWDEDSVMMQTYGIIGMPTGFLIDREGVVRKVHQGFRKSDGPKLRQEVIELLDQ